MTVDWWSLAVGVALTATGMAGVARALRKRRRLVRTHGTVVHRAGVWMEQNVRTRVTTFEFATASGEVVRATSGARTFPGPRVGSRVRVVYDRADPHGFAERVGVYRVVVCFRCLFLVGGPVLAVAAVVA